MISYKPLKKLLIDYDIKTIDLINDKILTPTNSVYINNDTGYINLRTINRLCNYLSDRISKDVLISDILLFIPDDPQRKE